MRKNILLASLVCGCMALSGANALAGEPVRASIGADLVSSYLFRGARMDGVSVQPSVTLEWEGLSVGAWGSTGLTGNYTEADWVLSYSIGDFTVGLTDYFCASTMDKFFDYGKESLHVGELMLGYDFGPASLTWYTNFAGAMGVTPDGKKSYSSYVEVSAPFSAGGLDFTATVGVSPWANSFYGVDGFGAVNCSLTASHDMQIGSVSVPAFVQLASNPSAGSMFLVAGISF